MKIPLFKIYWDNEDIKSVEKIIKSGMFWSSGNEIEELENKISEYIGSKYCVTFNSGGSALHALMKSYGFKEGDEIIVPSFTFIATAMAPLYVGAKPIFADIEEETLGLNPDDVLEKITNKTKAILPIHYGGVPCKIKELKEIADDYDLVLIEDAAEAFGAKIDDKNVGTFGDSAIFSFCQNKIFTTGEGGCITTNNKELYEKLKLIVSYGRISEGNYFVGQSKTDYVDIGYNWRLSTILASLGISQLNKVDKLIELRRKNAEYLNTELSKIKDVNIMPVPNNYFAVYQLYSIILNNEYIRNELMNYLKEKNISTKIYFEPCHEYTVFKKFVNNINLPTTQQISSKILTLPIYPNMTKNELNYIIDTIKEFFEGR
ncbi:Glutamine--scyllo-inositol transaminase [Methanococcus aeolicus Nankai-3]|uniref:Glutamine--scyllo-inositol transaminase n=1 Tax=Methanococcus aeolicus (strain ATCC BAA-1280 / DSM 17508 / OCM 812 / Nankai-3) TaxID=419665 RepID=A6UU41_META3|nr:DegT/DnrJ/EryC1/StrS family aminotransferase [Methanococcus aeolicus]ABR56013.1 Glutamine--scyllo-inositol transaminase [Methanococcus aeolicus Nankai-3]